MQPRIRRHPDGNGRNQGLPISKEIRERYRIRFIFAHANLRAIAKDAPGVAEGGDVIFDELPAHMLESFVRSLQDHVRREQKKSD